MASLSWEGRRVDQRAAFLFFKAYPYIQSLWEVGENECVNICNVYSGPLTHKPLSIKTVQIIIVIFLSLHVFILI